MDKWKARSKVKDMWDEDLKALYLMDLKVGCARKKYPPKPQKLKATGNSIAKRDPII